MDNPRARVNALIARALDSASSVEEARTSAHVAVRLIVQHGLLDSTPSPAPERPERRVIRSKYSTHCRHCFTEIVEGVQCAWGPKMGVICIPCYRTEQTT